MTGNLLPLELALNSRLTLSTKNEIFPVIYVGNNKLRRRHPKFVSGIESRGKGSRVNIILETRIAKKVPAINN